MIKYLHAQPAADDGGDGADNEGNAGHHTDEGGEDRREDDDVPGHVLVFLEQEGVGTVGDVPGDVFHGLNGFLVEVGAALEGGFEGGGGEAIHFNTADEQIPVGNF